MAKVAKRRELVKENPHLGPLDEYYNSNIKLVHDVAQKFAGRAYAIGLDYEDVLNEGSIGFLKAYEKFDPTSFTGKDGEGVKFSTYAVPKIKGEILRFFRDHNRGAKFPRSVKETASKIQKKEITEPLFRRRPPAEIAEIIETPLKLVHQALIFMSQGHTESLQSVVFENDGDPITLEDQIATHADQTSLLVDEFLDSLPEKFATVVKMRMLGKTQAEVGKVIGVSQVQVSRIEERIKEITRCWLEGKPIDWLLGYDEDETAVKPPPKIGNKALAVVLLKEGKLNQQKIVRETGCSTKTVSKLAKELQERGELPLEYSKKRRKKKGGEAEWQSLGSAQSVAV
jgi:RNA polymerase sporulation-specific sigma factor